MRPAPRFWLAVLAALGAGGFFAPTSARASCGDYVVMDHGTAPMPVQNGQPFSSDQRETPAQPARPCQGPQCSAPVDLPFTGVVPPRMTSHDQWAFMALPPPLPPIAEGDFLLLIKQDRLAGYSPSIFHPPRRFPS